MVAKRKGVAPLDLSQAGFLALCPHHANTPHARAQADNARPGQRGKLSTPNIRRDSVKSVLLVQGRLRGLSYEGLNFEEK